ncbi:hypothetical protein DAI22_03g294001 [Oryza sativa Japonica Group]|nr:hypothetical protein DAI22_03g294001 [Oryza sativa Japonica Group]
MASWVDVRGREGGLALQRRGESQMLMPGIRTRERHGSVAAPWQLLAHRYLATADGTSCFHMLFMWSVVTGYTGGMNPSEI